MSTNTDGVKFPYPTEGVIRSAQISDTVTPEKSAQLGINLIFDRIGSWMTRLGISVYAPQRGGAILSFGTLSIQGGVKRLLSQVGNDISAYDGASWTSVRTLTSAVTKARYSQFLNLTYMVNGNQAVAGSDPVQSYDGAAFGVINVGTLPKGDFINAGFEGRVWVADKNADAIYFTDIVQFTPPSTYVVTGGATNFIKNFTPQDGQSITGMFRVPRALLIFKQNYIIRVYGATSVDPYPAYNVGTYSQESIVQTKDGIYFHHPSGFYKFSYDNQPTEISRRVIDFVQAISRSNYENVVGTYDGSDHVLWSVGAVTVEGVTYSNCIMRYTISTQVWTISDVAGGAGVNSPTAMVIYDNGTVIAPLVGTNQGKVGRLEDGPTDFGLEIYYEYITRWISIVDLWTKVKKIVGFSVHAENAAGAEVQYQIDKDVADKWRDLGKMESSYVSEMPNGDTEDFNRMRIRIKGTSKGPQVIYNGIEARNINDKGYDKN